MITLDLDSSMGYNPVSRDIYPTGLYFMADTEREAGNERIIDDSLILILLKNEV